jgi:transcriptional regulator with XRE-family HTH domain
MNELDKAINNLLAEKRRNLKMTMLEVAKFLDKPHSFVGKVETDNRSLSVGELEVYCNALFVDIEDVIKEAKDKIMFEFEQMSI